MSRKKTTREQEEEEEEEEKEKEEKEQDQEEYATHSIQSGSSEALVKKAEAEREQLW